MCTADSAIRLTSGVNEILSTLTSARPHLVSPVLNPNFGHKKNEKGNKAWNP